MESLLSIHRHLVEFLLLVIVLNAFVPLVTQRNAERMILYTRIGFFAFWAAWAMAIFSGLIVWVFTKGALPPKVWGMIASAVVLGVLDATRAIGLHRRWRREEAGVGYSWALLTTEAALILTVTLWAVRG
ncbi:hypothetical protein [Nitratifractor sp.]